MKADSSITRKKASKVSKLNQAQSSSDNLQQQNELLRQENAKLKKINDVLIQRVDMGMGNHSAAYQSFENAVLLTDKVKQRTNKLQKILKRLEETNLQLSIARNESELFWQKLVDAIESISDAFVLFDEKGTMLLANHRFYELWDEHDVHFQIGVNHLEDVHNVVKELNLYDHKRAEKDELGSRSWGRGQQILSLPNGRWLRIAERPTTDKGMVLVFSDVTAIKDSETRRREKALAAKSQILQSTLDNISQGVALVNDNGELEAWNDSFRNIACLQTEQLNTKQSFAQLMHDNEVGFSVDANHSEAIYKFEKTLKNNQVIEVKHHKIRGGGYVNTYTDITERSRNEAALRESEQRIRLVTDAMPALISYFRNDYYYEFVNQEFAEWFKLPSTDIVGRQLKEIIGEDSYQNHASYLARAIDGEMVSFEMEETYKGKGTLIMHKTYVPHFNEQGNVDGVFALEQDVSQQRRTAQALKNAYLTMEDRVQDRTRELSELNKQLETEIKDRTRIQGDLIEAKRSAEEANISKTKFLASVSHDLLQPMNAAKLFVSTLNETKQKGKVGNLIKSLDFSLHDMESLLNSLVDISKLDAGVVEAVPDAFYVNDLLENLAKESAPKAQELGLEFNYIASSAVINSDSQLLARVLRNFLSNAFRYTQSGSITLGCRRRSDGLEIQILDTGCGICNETLDEIFIEFKRGDVPNKQDRGLGLGLAIVDKLSQVLDHSIDVRSQLGKGSMFSILVPYGKLKKNDAPEIEQSTIALDEEFEGQRILVVDNDVSICQGMSKLLAMWGYNVSTATCLDELKLNHKLFENADLLIADYHLEDDETGLQVIEYIQQYAQLPVIMITANYTNQLRQSMMDEGYYLINKPLKPLKLKSLMRHLLN